MQINEIFSSIEGEGIRAGFLATFIRTHFCNLRCSWCDTLYSLDGNEYKNMEIQEIFQKCVELNNKRITLTGGEPLLQKDIGELINLLNKNNFEINIETNGAIDLKEFVKKNNIDFDKTIFTMDYKCPSSTMEDKMILSNLEYLSSKDVLKFVVATKQDLDTMKIVMNKYKIRAQIFVSCVLERFELKQIVEYLKTNNLQQARLQLQIHKIIWNKETRGV